MKLKSTEKKTYSLTYQEDPCLIKHRSNNAKQKKKSKKTCTFFPLNPIKMEYETTIFRKKYLLFILCLL